MATKREPAKRPKRARKPARKVANSKISEAQAATTKRRAERDMPRSQQPGPIRPPDKKGSGDAYTVGQGSARGANPSLSDAANNTAILARQAMADPKNKGKSGQGNQSLAEAGQQIAGLAAPLIAKAQADRRNDPLTSTGLYGGPPKDRAKRLTEAITAQNQANTSKAKEKGQAVWMGPVKGRVKQRVVGDMPDEPGMDTYVETAGEQILTKTELLSWLTDDTKVQQIIQVAQKAGLAVETYEDAAKLWSSVVDMAASSYSLANKQVTPWALIQLRGKYAGADGKMRPKVSVNTNIDEMDPATARLMFEQTAQQALGRAPTKAEVDDFIAKAQTIARQNPVVTTTTSQVGFDGKADTQNSTSVTKGQGAAQAKAQLSAMDQAKQSEDYASYQAAGVYFPSLFEALQSPV